MTHFAALMVKKLTGATHLLVAAKHNKRTNYAKTGGGCRIDPSRTHLNESLLGDQTPKSIADMAQRMMEAANIRIRKDMVRALEFIVSLPRGHGIDADAYFRAAMAWIGKRYGGMQNVLSADIHRDEPCPHMHVLLLPLIAGRMTGSAAIGYKPKMAAMNRDFESEVAVPHGLCPRIAKLVGNKKAEASSAVRGHMKTEQDPAMLSPAWPVIQADIDENPEPYLTAFNIDAPTSKTKRMKSSTDIFISKGKGSKVESRNGAIRERNGAPKPMLCRLPPSPKSASAHLQH